MHIEEILYFGLSLFAYLVGGKVKMKKIIALTLIFLATSFLFAAGSGEKSSSDVKIGISKFITHAALDSCEKGFKDYLATTGLSIQYDEQNAQGDASTAATIAQKFKDGGCDIVYGIATPTAQALVNAFPTKPVIFAAVTDPVAAGLVESWEGSSDINVCGVSDNSPIKDQIELLANVTGAKIIGNIYNSSEANATVQQQDMQKACKELGLELVSAAVTNTSEVRQATQAIIDRVDAIYIATDNVVISALSSVVEVAHNAGKGLLAGDPSMLEQGVPALIAWGPNYYNIGQEAGRMAEKIIKGENAGSLGSVVLSGAENYELWFNLDTAKELGIEIDSKYLDLSAVTIENGQINRK